MKGWGAFMLEGGNARAREYKGCLGDTSKPAFVDFLAETQLCQAALLAK